MTYTITPESTVLAVLGAGTMGHGIAQIAVAAGFRTRLQDISEGALERGRGRIVAVLDGGVARGKLAPEARDAALARLSVTTDLAEAVRGADVVIEAAPERTELKQQILAAVHAVSPNAIFGTNTSSLSVTGIASASPHPERVVGMHFFNPPHIMKLLEVVRGRDTAPDVLDATRALGLALGRELIVVSDSAGFATSRLGLVIGLEAIRMLEQGVASAAEIDLAMKSGYRHPMGPLELTDLVGLDVRLAIAEHLHRELGEVFRPPELLRRLVAAGRHGKKTGLGFYDWSSGEARPPVE